MLSSRVHHLAEQFLVCEFVAGVLVAGAFYQLAAKTLDFIGGHPAEVVVKRFAGLELFAVDEERVGLRKGVPRGLVEIAEEAQPAIFEVEVPSSFWRWKPEM